MIKRKYLYLIASFIWGIPGVIITTKGLTAYTTQVFTNLYWGIPLTCLVIGFFYFMFNKVVNKYSQRIASLPPLSSPLKTFSLKGWILLIFMMGLGISFKFIPQITPTFIAVFYSGLGPMLILSAIRFATNYYKE